MEIYLTDRVKCHPDWFWQSSVNGWNGYHIWLVEGGRGHISVSGEEYELLPGDVFLFDLKEEHFCTHSPQKPLEVSTVYFGCEEIDLRTRIIRKNVLLGESVKKILECVEKNQTSQACLWLNALVSSFWKILKKNRFLELFIQPVFTWTNTCGNRFPLQNYAPVLAIPKTS